MDPIVAASSLEIAIKGGVAVVAIVALVWVVRWMVQEIVGTFKAESAATREQHDKHITALVGAISHLGKRVDVLEGDVGDIKDALGIPPRLRVVRPDEDPKST